MVEEYTHLHWGPGLEQILSDENLELTPGQRQILEDIKANLRRMTDRIPAWTRQEATDWIENHQLYIGDYAHLEGLTFAALAYIIDEAEHAPCRETAVEIEYDKTLKHERHWLSRKHWQVARAKYKSVTGADLQK